MRDDEYTWLDHGEKRFCGFPAPTMVLLAAVALVFIAGYAAGRFL